MIYEQAYKAPFMENPVVLVKCEKLHFLRELIVFLTYTFLLSNKNPTVYQVTPKEKSTN